MHHSLVQKCGDFHKLSISASAQFKFKTVNQICRQLIVGSDKSLQIAAQPLKFANRFAVLPTPWIMHLALYFKISHKNPYGTNHR